MITGSWKTNTLRNVMLFILRNITQGFQFQFVSVKSRKQHHLKLYNKEKCGEAAN
jgi:hypothetical protein